jgi:sarcosine oxidase, subunit gamma
MANTANAQQSGAVTSAATQSANARSSATPSAATQSANARSSATPSAAVPAAAAQSSGAQPGAGPTPRAQAAVRQAARITASALVRPLPPATRYVLRGGPLAMTAAGNALGLNISEVACRAAVNGTQAAALWLGPDEQLLIGPESTDVAATLTAALRDLPHSLVDVSHRQIALEISGPHAAAVLNAGCPLDLDLSAFPVGMCTRTVFAKAEIVLWRTSTDVFHVEVWRSFASYLTEFLAEVAREVAVLTPNLES